MKVKKRTRPPLVVKINGTFNDALKVFFPPPPKYVWKVGFHVIVDPGKKARVIGKITEIVDDVFVVVQTRDKESIQVNRNRLKKK